MWSMIQVGKIERTSLNTLQGKVNSNNCMFCHTNLETQG